MAEEVALVLPLRRTHVVLTDNQPAIAMLNPNFDYVAVHQSVYNTPFPEMV